MIATGNHNHFDSLRGAPPSKGSLGLTFIRLATLGTFPPWEDIKASPKGEPFNPEFLTHDF